MSEFQNIILEMIARGMSLEETIQRLCVEVDRIFPDGLCSVLRVDSRERLQSLAAPRLPVEYTALIDGVAIGPNVGACGAAAYFAAEVETHDIEHDPNWNGFCDLLLPMGIKACWSSPILGPQGQVIATFAFYYRENRGPSPREREIVAQCMHLCAIALDRHRRVRDHERRANTDFLTGLPNRAAFDAALTGLDCAVPGAWAICVVDLDNLKVTNDTFGHQAGDTLIRHVADRLAAAVSPDRVYRIGGDEFAIVVADAEALGCLERTVAGYLAALSPPAECGGHIIGPRATIGFAVLSHGDRAAERVRQNADFALYHAKETGRGGFVRYWPGIGTRMTRRLTAIREVDAALREKRIVPFYQPITLLETGEIVGLEALCRMRIGDTYVPASLFHEATTDASIATSLTAQMIAQVARDVRAWLDMGIPFQHVGINVSSADLHGGRIYAVLAEAFEREGVSLEHVILEVTEMVYMDDDAGVVRKSMEALRARGLRIALDDFGTGYASLTHLMTVPVDIIKIDKSFVDDIVSHGASAAIVEGIIGIAQKLGIKVVAEGVEKADQARQLMKLGCALGQGFYFSEAVNARQTGAMMLELAQGIGGHRIPRSASGTPAPLTCAARSGEVRGMSITTALLVHNTMPSPVGELTLVASDVGVVAVLWQDDRPGRVPLGPTVEAPEHPVLVEAEAQLRAYFAGRRRVFDLPLDVRGTQFQRAVWSALVDIPFGETRSYGELAGAIGHPSASRAVGAANGRNPISIIAPCHRVIGGSGALTGFAGGLEAKAWLLGHEGQPRLL